MNDWRDRVLQPRAGEQSAADVAVSDGAEQAAVIVDGQRDLDRATIDRADHLT